MIVRRTLIGLMLVVGLIGCSGPVLGEPQSPPDLVVSSGESVVSLSAHTYCWSSGRPVSTHVCADGMPQEPLPRLLLNQGSEMAARFPFPWNLDGEIFTGNDDCQQVTGIEFAPSGVPVALLAAAGVHRLEIFGRGERGDASWALDVELPVAGAQASPHLEVYWYPSDGRLDPGAAFSVLLFNLDAEPEAATASVTVLSPGSGNYSFDLIELVDERECWAGSIAFEGSDTFTNDVIAIGLAPYELTATLDLGIEMVTAGPIVWPDDFPINSNESTARYEVREVP